MNGSLVGEWPSPPLRNNGNLLELGWKFLGALDDVTVFSRELNATEVEALAVP